MDVEARLRDLGVTLPKPPRPVASYQPAVRTGNLIFVSGQVPVEAGEPIVTGRVPSAVPIAQAERALRQCVYNGLAALKDYLAGDLSRLRRVVRIGVFVASDDSFHGQPHVANAASDLLHEILGEAGRHARTAVGVNALPLDVPVEVEFLFEVE